jgi:hypothetical protein
MTFTKQALTRMLRFTAALGEELEEVELVLV